MPPFPDFARRLRPDPAGTDDAELLRRFADHRDEAAFELLVWRHGGMVLAACRRVLGRSADADDAFQVTFLALARRAGSIRTGAALPGWLHRTARRAAGRVKAAAVRRAERPAADAPEPAVEPTQPDDLGPVIDEEIDRLPEKLRRAFVLCHLEGVTNEAAAARLGCPKGTVLSRLSRARERLRERLTRRGVVASALLALPVAAPPSAAVAAATARAAAAFAAGSTPPDIPVHVVTIAQGVLRTMRLTQLRPIGLVLALALVAGAGLAATAGRPAPADPPASVPVAVRPAPAPVPAPAGPRRLAVDKHDCPDVGEVDFSPDGSVVAVGGAKADGNTVEDVLTLWDAATGRHLHTFRGDDAGNNGFGFSPDGKLIALPVTGLGEVIVRDVASGKVVRRLAHPLVGTAEFAPDGKHLVTVSTGFAGRETLSELHVWEAATGKRVFSPTRDKDETFNWAFFAPDGRLVIGTNAARVRSWNPATGVEAAPVRLAGGAVRFGVPSRDGKQFLTTTAGRPHLHDAAGEVVRTFGRDGDAYEFAGFSADAKTVFGTTKAARVTAWDAATGTQKATFTLGDTGNVEPFLQPTPDDRYLVAQWSRPTGDGNDTVATVAVYTPDGRLVRRERGATDAVFDRAGRSVVVVTRTPATAAAAPRYDVTIHAAATWLAGGAKKE